MKLLIMLLALMTTNAFSSEKFPRDPIKCQGGPVSLKDQVMIVNLWATWCEACKIELKEMQTQFKDLPDKNVRLVFLSLDKDMIQAAKYFDDNHKDLSKYLCFDPGFELVETLHVDSFPTTLVIAKDGSIVYTQKGFSPSQNSTERVKEEALKLLKP